MTQDLRGLLNEATMTVYQALQQYKVQKPMQIGTVYIGYRDDPQSHGLGIGKTPNELQGVSLETLADGGELARQLNLWGYEASVRAFLEQVIGAAEATAPKDLIHAFDHATNLLTQQPGPIQVNNIWVGVDTSRHKPQIAVGQSADALQPVNVPYRDSLDGLLARLGGSMTPEELLQQVIAQLA